MRTEVEGGSRVGCCSHPNTQHAYRLSYVSIAINTFAAGVALALHAVS